MKKIKHIVALTLFLFCCNWAAGQVTGPCDPLPCPAPDNSMIVDSVYQFNSMLYNDYILDEDGDYVEDEDGNRIKYSGEELTIQCGHIYKFDVVAGAIYEWNTDISHGQVTPGGDVLRTRITLFYDDFQTPITASQDAVNTEIEGCEAAGLAWKANYTGTVGVMVTRGDQGIGSASDFCACNGAPLYLRCVKRSNPKSSFFVWGRYGTSRTLTCDDEIHFIYDSGLNSELEGATGNYSNNENGYLVLYPGDSTAKLKLWGAVILQTGDSLFLYNGDISLNPHLTPCDTITGQSDAVGSESEPIFISQYVNQPISLRMQTDSSCTLAGLTLKAKCCLNPSLPTGLHGEMTSDTSAYLHWHSAEGNDLRYDWELFRSDTVSIAAGTTNDTTLTYNDLDPNQCYFYTISVRSACSNDTASDGGVDVVYSNTFCYPYFVTLGNEEVNHHVSSDTLILPDGCYYDTIWVDSVYYEVVVVHESDLRVCYGNTAQICYSFSDNVNIERQLVWKTSYDSLGVAPVDTTFYLGDTTTHTHDIGTDDFHSCFTTTPITEDGYLTLEVYTDGHSLARAVMHIIVDSIPDVYLTVNGIDTSDFTVCEGDIIYLQGYNADSYQWTDSLLWFNRYTVNQEFQLTVNENNAYYVTGINSHHCSATDTLHLHINPKPDLVYEQNVSVCGNDSVLLHVEGISNYTWQRVDTIEYDTTFLHYSNWIWGFQLKDSMLTKNPLDNNFFIFSQPYSNCIDTLTAAQLRLPDSLYHFPYTDSSFNNYKIGYLATDHIVYQTYNTIANGTMDSLWVHPDRSTDYIVSGTDTNGCHCRSNAVIHVNVLDVPVSAILCEDTSLCLGDTLTAQAFINHTYYWWDERQTPDSLSNVFWTQYVPDSVGAHILHVQVTNQHGCHIELEQPFTVFPPPEVNATAAPDSICLYESTTLTATGNAITYIWDGQPAGSSIVTTPDSSGYFAVTGIDEHGCRNRDSIWVEVKYLPSREQVGDQHICQGDSVTIVTTGDAAQYIWSLNGNVISEGTSITLHPADTTSYHLAYTYDNGCSSETDFAVNVHFYPTPHVEPVDTICRGQSIALHASGGNYYLWNDAARQTTDSILVTPDSTTTYTVMVYDTTLCPTYDSVTVPVIPYFDLFISGTRDSICQGQSVTFTVSGGDEYLWSNGSHDSSIVLTPDSTTIVSVSAVNHSTSCSHTVYDTIVVMPNPLVEIITTQDTLCHGQSTTLSAIGNADQYQWDINSTDSVISVTPELTTLYSVTATDFYGDFNCTQTAQQNINVNPLPSIFNIVLQHDSICYEDSTIIQIDTEFYNVQYHWSLSEIPLTDASFTYHPNIDQPVVYTDTLLLTIEDQNGCLRHDTTEVTVLPMPRDTIIAPDEICFNESFQLSVNGHNTYHWNNPIPPAQSNLSLVQCSIQQNTNFSVKVTNSYGCELTLRKSVEVNPLPNIEIHSTNTGRYCSNQSYVLTATGGLNYVWSTDQTDSSITVTPSHQHHTYIVTGTDENGCENWATINLSVVDPPTVTISVTNDTICAFDTVSISASGDFENIIWNTGSIEYSFTVNDLTQSTQYIATVSTNDHGTTCSFTDTVDIYVQPVPTLHVTSDSSICSNTTGSISVSGANSYHWLPNSLLDTLEGHHVTILPSTDTVALLDTFTVIGEFATGCRTVSTIPYVIQPLPVLSIEPSSDHGICLGESITLQGHGGVHYHWATADNPQQTIDSSSVLTLTPTQTTTYLMWADNIHGCVDTVSIEIPVYQHPTLDISTSVSEICYGLTTTLTATSNGHVYQWNHAESLDDSTAASTVARPLENTHYTIIVTDSVTGCTTTGSTDIIVHQSPQISSDISTGVCATDSIGVTVSGATHYQWFYGNLTDVIHTGSYYEAPPITLPVTTYTVIGTDDFGCRDTLDIPVLVNAIPDLSINISSPGYLCKNGTNFLGISVSSNIPNTTFEWTAQPADPSMFTNEGLAFVSPDTTTTYTVTGYYTANGATCSAIISDIVTVYDAPNVIATGAPDLICRNAEVSMSATGAIRYIWYYQGQIVSLDSVYTTIPNGATQYGVVGIDGRNCIGRDTVEVTYVDEIPTDTILSSTTICYNVPTEIRTTGHNHCYWYPQTGLSNISDSSVTVTLTEDAVYYVVITNEYGCTDTMTVPIHVNPIPQLTLNPDTFICLGSSYSFRVSGGISYDWNDGSHNDFRIETPDTTTTYYVTGYNEYHCPAEDSITIRVLPPFDLSITASRDTFCFAGEPITLTAYGAGDNYEWSNGSRDSIIIVYPDQTTTYTLTAFNNSVRCEASTDYTIVQMTHPVFTAGATRHDICLHDSTQLFVHIDSNDFFQWSSGDTLSVFTIAPNEDTDYQVSVSNAFGCMITDTIAIRVHPLPEVDIISSDTAVCYGRSIQYNATGNAIRFEWENGDTLSTFSEIITHDGMHTLTGFTEYNCLSRDTIEVQMQPLPSITLSISDSIICIGDTTRLNVTGDYLFRWNGDNVLTNLNSNYIMVDPTVSSDYQVIATNNLGCQDSLTATVFVYDPLPLEITPDTAICLGSAVTMTATGSWNYLWNTGATNNTFTVTPTQTTQYSVSSTDQHGCVTSISSTITLYPDFDVALFHDRDTVCLGQEVHLWYSDNADHHQWNTGSTAESITVMPTENSIYTLTATNNVFGCQKTLYDTIIVLPYPEIDLNATNVCAGDTITIYATHSYPFQYSWETISEAVHIASGNNGQITSVPQVPTQFVYHATNHFCTLTDTFAVDVKPLPNIQIVASDTAVCFGNVVQLTAAGNAQQYQWSDGTIGSTLSLAETMSNAAYILTGTSEYGCISKDTTFVTIHPLPTGTLTGINHKICPGDTIPLTATNGYEYHWTPEAGLITNLLAQVLASPRVPTLYQVVLTNAYGCQDSLTTFVDVYDPLPLMISADTAVCFGNPATVSVSGSWNYLWNTGATNNTFTVTPDQTTEYSVSSTDLNGCVTTVSTTVTVYPDFEVEMLHARDTICLGESVTLWYTGSADHYQWSTGSTTESITVSPVTNSVYHLVATNYVNNCAKTLSDTIIVLPYPQFELNGPALICAGDTITVSAFHSYPFQYSWETIPATTAFSPESSSFVTVAPTLPTQFVYHASNHICTLTDTLEIDVAPLPTIVIDNLADETCEQGNGAITVSANSEYEPVSYSWSTGSSSTTIDQLAQGTYSVTVTDALGCVNTMGDIEVENIPSPEVEVLAIDPVLNRTDGSITIDIGDHHGNYTIEWYDHEPLTEPLSQYENSITANNVHTGTYWITVTDDACTTTVSAIVPQIDDPEGGIWLPNCITASNTDGLNDKFYIVHSGEIEFKYIKFFNRWGELVYQSTDIDAKWDGSCNGKIYHNVVYNYIMEYVNYAGTRIKKQGSLVVL